MILPPENSSIRTRLAIIGQKGSSIDALMPSFEAQLRDLPIAINALADPAILRESSASKLDQLVEDQHTGPVAIITKGNLDTEWWRPRLKRWVKSLDLYIFASISGLPKSYEPVSLENRFKTLQIAREVGATSICYLRPIVPGVNDSPELLKGLVEKAHFAGCHAVVSSGFRGAESIVEDSGFKERHKKWEHGWLPSVKLHTNDMESFVRTLCREQGIGFWTGTSCAVSALRGEAQSRSPYHIAPQFAGCETCSIRDTCYGTRMTMKPKPGSLELLRFLGFRVSFDSPDPTKAPCPVTVRSQCSLHCTNCTRSSDFGYPTVRMRRWNGTPPSWGDLCLGRFLTGGMLCTDSELSDKEESTIALAPQFALANKGAGSLYATTTWMMWSEYLPKEKCFKCSYCFVGMYKDSLPAPMQGTVGISPVRLLERVK